MVAPRRDRARIFGPEGGFKTIWGEIGFILLFSSLWIGLGAAYVLLQVVK